MCVNEHAGVEGVLPIRTHLPLAHPCFSLVLSGNSHYMQVSLAIRERKHKLGSGMQGFLHESERKKERYDGWEGVKREGRQRIREGSGLFCIDLSAFCVANTEKDTKKESEKEDRDGGSSYSLQTSSLAF